MSGAPTRILHPTDFSDRSFGAFAHALRLALASRSRLYLLHVEIDGARRTVDAAESDWTRFPRIRDILVLWGFLDATDTPSAIEARLGVQISRDVLVDAHARRSIADYAHEHGCDLLVMGTHARQGLKRWLNPSVAEDASQLARLPCLFVPQTTRGFVDVRSGAADLDCLLIPVSGQSAATQTLRRMEAIVRPLADKTRLELLHVGHTRPKLLDDDGTELDLPLDVRSGPVVETIVATAGEIGARLIAMATTGRHGFVDGLRGSTVERVVRRAPCPVLAVPEHM